MSLVELTLTCAMLGIVMVLVTSMTISMLTSNQENVVRQSNVDDARIAMDLLAQDLDRMVIPAAIDDANRSTAIVDAGPDRITFWAARGTGTTTDLTTVTFERCADATLVSSTAQTAPEEPSSPCDNLEDPEVHVLAQGVQPGLFTYWPRGAGDPVVPEPTPDPTAPETPGPATPPITPIGNPNADRGAIGSVEAIVALGGPRDRTTYVTGTSTVIRRFHLTQWKDF
jgi:hypothetical protein